MISSLRQDFWAKIPFDDRGYLDAHGKGENDSRAVTRHAQSNSTQEWVITRLETFTNGMFRATVQQGVYSGSGTDWGWMDAHEGQTGAFTGFSVVTRQRQAGDPTQEWIFTPVDGAPDTYTIQQASTNRYLDAFTDDDEGHDWSAVTRDLQTLPIGEYTWFDQYSPSNRTRAGQYNHRVKWNLSVAC